jgi:lysophospholipid acyltransferase (LPLAT)-like uncharacterized protein
VCSSDLLVPLSSACARGWRFRHAWDGFVLPKPFSRVVVVAGEPLAVPADAPVEALERPREALERTLGELAEVAERAVKEEGGATRRG